MKKNSFFLSVGLICIVGLWSSCDFLLSYPEAIGKSLEPLFEFEGILFRFRVAISGDFCSPGSSFDVWTGNYGSYDFLDKNGQPKYWLPARHPDTSGIFSFAEYSRNYYGKVNRPEIEDICPLVIYIRSPMTESNLYTIESDQMVLTDTTRNEYTIGNLILKCK